MSVGKQYKKSEILSQLKEKNSEEILDNEYSRKMEVTDDPISLIKKLSSYVAIYKGDVKTEKVADVYYTPTGIIIYIDYFSEEELPFNIKDLKGELISWLGENSKYHFEDFIKLRRVVSESTIMTESSYIDKENEGIFSVLYNLLSKRIDEDEAYAIMKRNDDYLDDIVDEGDGDFTIQFNTNPIEYFCDDSEGNRYLLYSILSDEGDYDRYLDDAWQQCHDESVFWDITYDNGTPSTENYTYKLSQALGYDIVGNAQTDYSTYAGMEKINVGLEYEKYIEKIIDLYCEGTAKANNNGFVEAGQNYHEEWVKGMESKFGFSEGYESFEISAKRLFSVIAQRPPKTNKMRSVQEVFNNYEPIRIKFGESSDWLGMGVDSLWDHWDDKIWNEYQEKGKEEAKDFYEGFTAEYAMELKELGVAEGIIRQLGLEYPKINSRSSWRNRDRVMSIDNVGVEDVDNETYRIIKTLDKERVLAPTKNPKDKLPFKNAGLTHPIFFHYDYDFVDEVHILVGVSPDLKDYNIVRLSNQKFKAVIGELGLKKMGFYKASQEVSKPQAKFNAGDKVRFKDETHNIKAVINSVRYNPKGNNWAYSLTWPEGQYGGTRQLTVWDDNKLTLAESTQNKSGETSISVYYAIMGDLVKHYGEEKANLIGKPTRIEIGDYKILIDGAYFVVSHKDETKTYKSEQMLAKNINGRLVEYPNPKVLFDLIPKEKDYGVKSEFMDGTNMRASQKFWDHIKYEEGSAKEKGKPVLKAYDLEDGRITIGYGHTKDVKMGDVITPQQAQQLLQEDAKWAADCVRRLLAKWKSEKNDAYMVTQPIFDVLVSLVFNAGCAGLRRSDFIQLIKKRNYLQAAKLLPVDSSMKSDKYDKALTARREREAKWMLE